MARAFERRVDARSSAVDGISTAVVLCLQSGPGRKSQGTDPAAWNELSEEALQRCLDSTVG